MIDMTNKGRNVPPNLAGEHHGRSKLKYKDVVEIRKLYDEAPISTSGRKKKGTFRMLSNKFNVHKVTIAQIVYKKHWTRHSDA